MKLFAWKGGAVPLCWLQSVNPSPAVVPVGSDFSFTASGSMLSNLQWTSSSSVPPTGTGAAFSTKWNSVGSYTVTASACSPSKSIDVTVVAVKAIVKEGAPVDSPPDATMKLGTSLNLKALRNPNPEDGAWPNGQPQWKIVQDPEPDFSLAKIQSNPPNRGAAQFTPSVAGTYIVEATCGSSSAQFTISVQSACGSIVDVSDDRSDYKKMENTGGAAGVLNIVGPKSETAGAVLRLTAVLATGSDRSKVSWEGATADPAQAWSATISIDQSVRKDVTILYDGEPCRMVKVWPAWATVSIKLSSSATLSGNNNAQFILPDHTYPARRGGGSQLGPVDADTNQTLADGRLATCRVEAAATLSPAGVADIVPDSSWRFRRDKRVLFYSNGVKLDDSTQATTPLDDSTIDPNLLDRRNDGDDMLFDLDAPALALPIDHTAERYRNFRQYVSIDFSETQGVGTGFRCSAYVPWWCFQRVDNDKPTGKVELNQAGLGERDFPSGLTYPPR